MILKGEHSLYIINYGVGVILTGIHILILFYDIIDKYYGTLIKMYKLK